MKCFSPVCSDHKVHLNANKHYRKIIGKLVDRGVKDILCHPRGQWEENPCLSIP